MGCVRGDSAFGGIRAHQGHVAEGRHQYSSAQRVPVRKLLLLAGQFGYLLRYTDVGQVSLATCSLRPGAKSCGDSRNSQHNFCALGRVGVKRCGNALRQLLSLEGRGLDHGGRRILDGS